MKTRLFILIVLLSTIAEGNTYPVEITNARTNAALPDLCLSLRIELNRGRDTSWDDTICLGEFALRGMSRHNVNKSVREARESSSDSLKDAREPFKLDPDPAPPTTGIGTP